MVLSFMYCLVIVSAFPNKQVPFRTKYLLLRNFLVNLLYDA